MEKFIKYIILIFIMLICTSYSTEYYENLVPGLPVGGDKVVGGLYKKTTPECGHDQSTIEMLKQESIKNAANWRRLAYGTSIFAFICLCIWYLSKVPEFGGLSGISIVFSLFSTFMAALVSITWLIVLTFVGMALIALGIYLHKKSFFEYLKNRKKQKQKEQRLEHQKSVDDSK